VLKRAFQIVCRQTKQAAAAAPPMMGAGVEKLQGCLPDKATMRVVRKSKPRRRASSR
jgi:hypothetical protein